MNKIQYIELLKLRGITELNGISIAKAVEDSGGNPSTKEMVEVNFQSMSYYADKFLQEQETNKKLIEQIDRLEQDSKVLRALEAAGVDNWEGYDIAMDMLED